MSFAFIFFVALFASWFLIPLLIKHSVALKMMDYPTDERKVHSKHGISRAGGLGIIAAATLAISVSLLSFTNFSGLFAAAMIIIVFGIADDIWQFSARQKFLGQIVAVLVAMMGGVVIENVPLLSGETPAWCRYAVSFLFLLGVTNAVNLTDGLDGLAGGSTLLSLGLIAVLSALSDHYWLMTIAMALMGGISGFLRYNTHPAQVFMGDAGSQFIGFMAACLAILVSQDPGANYSTMLPLLIMGLPILDTFYVIVVRIINKRSPFSPDSNHLHHRLIRLNFPHHEAVAVVYVAQTLLMIVAFTLREASNWLLAGIYIVFCSVVLGSIIVAKRVGWQRRLKRRILHANAEAERRNPVFRHIGESFYELGQLLSLLIVGSFALAVFTVFTEGYKDPTLGMICALSSIGLTIAFIVSNTENSERLVRVVVSSAVAILLFTASEASHGEMSRYLLDVYTLLIAAVLVVGVRITRRYLDMFNTQDFLILCILLSLAALPIEPHSIYLAIRIVIVMYALEYLITVRTTRHKLINMGSIACLLAMSYTLLS